MDISVYMSTYTEYSRSYFVFELEKAVWKKFVVIISLYFPSAMSEYLMSEYLHVIINKKISFI